jgi:hypothetical protein
MQIAEPAPGGYGELRGLDSYFHPGCAIQHALDKGGLLILTVPLPLEFDLYL